MSPFLLDTPLPVAAFLYPPLGRDSGAALLETLGTTLIRSLLALWALMATAPPALALAAPIALPVPLASVPAALSALVLSLES